MTQSLIAISLWVVLAFVLAAFPSTDNHWRRAYVLIVIGLPLLAWVTWQAGPMVGLFAVIVGGSVLRWPLFYLWRWLRRAR